VGPSLLTSLSGKRIVPIIGDLRPVVADYIEHFYKSARRHSAIGYATPGN
jgi:hypothetical protein